jgi:uncharacterized membrane protein
MTERARHLAIKFLEREWDNPNEQEKLVIESLTNRKHLSRNIKREFDDRTFGERVADGVARFGSSWTFMGLFAATLIFGVILNSYILASRDAAFDPYPYILLNLFLSMLASVQAAIIMMSQNRQAARDRIDAAHDYGSESEIRARNPRAARKIRRSARAKMGGARRNAAGADPAFAGASVRARIGETKS